MLELMCDEHEPASSNNVCSVTNTLIKQVLGPVCVGFDLFSFTPAHRVFWILCSAYRRYNKGHVSFKYAKR